jgi:uncharacterized Tic20 family protein
MPKNLADEISQLNELKEKGTLSEEEFNKAKSLLLSKKNHANHDIKFDEKEWASFIHLSLFLGYLIPLAGLIVPIVLWQSKKSSPFIDQHGRSAANWIITQIILWIAFVLLCFVLIGIPLLAILGVLSIIFPIMGAIRAREHRAWSYPLSFRVFKEAKL